MWSITARCLEHELQTKKPHFRQWCRRLVVVNLLKQRMHLKAAWSGIQVTAKSDLGWQLLPCSRLDRQSSMCSIQARFSSNEGADTKKDLRGVRMSHWFLISIPSSMSSSSMSSGMTVNMASCQQACPSRQPNLNAFQTVIHIMNNFPATFRHKLEFRQSYPLLEGIVSSLKYKLSNVQTFSNSNHNDEIIQIILVLLAEGLRYLPLTLLQL